MTKTHGPWYRCMALLTTLTFALAACSSLQGIPMPKEPGKTPAVKVGEQVEVTTRQGQTLRFTSHSSGA